ncbi:MAG: MoaD/ThiS family protein [Nitrososphaerales archaeon]
MRLKILYFASARDIVGKKGELLTIDDDARTVSELADMLQGMHPGLRGLENATRYAVNLEIVEGDAVLHEGDEVGVLPAVTGG